MAPRRGACRRPLGSEDGFQDPIDCHYRRCAFREFFSSVLLLRFDAGPIVGRHFPSDDSAPRAVTKEYFLKTFPLPEERKRISIKEVNDSIGCPHPVMNTYNRWVEILSSDDPVVELYGDMEHPFDYL